MNKLFALIALSATAFGAPVTPEQVRDYLIQFEGNSLTPYKDGNSQSVGVGHSLRNELVKASYSPDEIKTFFASDFKSVQRICHKGIREFDALPEDVQLVCFGLAWTVGPTGFMKFRNLRLALSYRMYGSAMVELYDSKWRTQTQRQRYLTSYATLKRHYQ